MIRLFFFFNDTATTEIYTLSLHDALPIYHRLAVRADGLRRRVGGHEAQSFRFHQNNPSMVDRKSTRLNSSHGYISYAVFCLKKKKIRSATPACCASEQFFGLNNRQHNSTR